MLALTTKSRTGMLALISTLSGERVDVPFLQGRAGRPICCSVATLRWRAFSPKEPIPALGIAQLRKTQYLLPQRPVHLAPLRRGFPLCPNIGNHLPRSRICFGAEERNSPRVIIGKASSPALRPEGGAFSTLNSRP